MPKFKWFAKYWLPVILWAVVIYSASGDKKSVHHSSRIIEPIVRWLIPDISDEAVRNTVLFVRKGAHVTEYAIFAMVFWWALRGTFAREHNGWSRRLVLGAWSAAVLFAITDEWHQAYVPGRQGSPWDVLIDAVGAASGLFFLWRICRWREVRCRRKTEAPAIRKD